MQDKLIDFNPLDFFKTEEDFKELLYDAFASQDPKYMARALGIVAKAKGIGILSKQCNLNRANLYRSLSDKGNPTLTTLVSVLNNLGYRINISPL